MSTTTTTTTEKRIKVTLTGRRPLALLASEWGVVAHATGGDCHTRDPARRAQALRRGECRTWSLTARQHSDGRALVYARTLADWYGRVRGQPGGELLPPGADLAAALRRVGERAGLPHDTIAEAIADLPAEEV